MKWIKYEVTMATAVRGSMEEILSHFGVDSYEIRDNIPPTPAEAKKMFTDIPLELPPDTKETVFVFYSEPLEADEDSFYSTGSSLRDESLHAAKRDADLLSQPEAFIPRFKEQIEGMQIAMPEISFSWEDDSDWKDKWKENFKPFRIADDILIKPTWEEIPADCSPRDIVLSIDPGSAFGTGTHETTRLCLLSLRKYISPDTRLLDAGCGSGILAIAALLCGAKSAFCLDIDPLAVSGTIENANINEIAPERLTAVNANILTDAASIRTQTGEPFDMVVANILADVIIPLSSVIGDFLKPDGVFISSGILAEKAADVEQALSDNHFTILEKNTMGDWVSFAAKKRLPH